ncbi:MAG: cell division ATP-binding protein FtsE [Candidatus Infernicultor aquiphilus]|uniref:Cell division ATP-binding protein FtsE n=1 Tax=Candidatus Infernicultor aquiphilus TaxID=1805029 RepID=A0A1J5GHK6_9BACT|nr:cell division ATP-binding protein FtsE [bacterium]OIP71756.1 MAG: cell division ATP-binding protein FtsE [Candidatus Atribacteria bacterium CG2_30_33_13]PIW12669.1 MAG: cell division ATP-binding protein FtsE [Candidatus Atribacteria bacterium CG17_big_fil_post_rev_8_21_14_2_50_34_11]PIY31280.1 MAG: cell division ATP-binding protein FtsE [Candidatus Atribacteria bacterium CG_4_10_14_3_um_filter_34_13]PJB58112.1 MAG: cell division ATP-binding protein FtsE [Candidatus Atribacteria bacterium CG_
MIRMFHVYKTYHPKIQALIDVNIHIRKGEFVFLVGPTGAGKSTFLKLIYREIIPTKGQVIIDGINISRLKPSYIPYLRRNIGIVFQDFKLLYNRTVYENISFGLKAIGATNFEIRQQVKKVLNLMGLEHKKNVKSQLLSGGEQQKLCIARAIANEPLILLTDEPTGNLDPDTSWEIMQLLFHINIRGTTIIMASHNKLIVDKAKKRVVRVERGKIIEDTQRGIY